MKTLFSVALACAVAIAAAAPAAAQTNAAGKDDAIYQAMGQDAGIKKIVDDFLVRVRADVRVKDAFKDVDLDRLQKMLREQFCFLGGGPCVYTGHDMKESHIDLKITNAQFNAITEALQLSMEQQGVPSAMQNKLIAKLAPMQREIVTR